MITNLDFRASASVHSPDSGISRRFINDTHYTVFRISPPELVREIPHFAPLRTAQTYSRDSASRVTIVSFTVADGGDSKGIPWLSLTDLTA